MCRKHKTLHNLLVFFLYVLNVLTVKFKKCNTPSFLLSNNHPTAHIFLSKKLYVCLHFTTRRNYFSKMGPYRKFRFM